MNNVKAVFIDSEGTLRNKFKEIENDTIETLKKLKSVGIHVVLTTGLPRFLSRNISLKANASRYLISSNGADIYDINQDRSIKDNYIESSIIKDIYNLGNKDYNLIFGVGEYEYSNLVNEYNLTAKSIKSTSDLEKGIYQVHISQRKLDFKKDCYIDEIKEFFKTDNVELLKLLIGEEFFGKLINTKISSLATDDLIILVRAIRYIKLYNLKNEILNRYQDKISIGNQSLDFTKFQLEGETPWFSLNKNGVNKGYAIKNLCQYLNIDLASTVAIGNDYNDKSMSSVVKTFICPTDAREFLKEETDVIYNEKEGVNKVLKKIYERR